MTDSTSHSSQHSVVPAEPDPNLIKWLKENCVPIVGIVSGALVSCLVAHYSSITVDRQGRKISLSHLGMSLNLWLYLLAASGPTLSLPKDELS
jgi:hypothetical protein